MPLSAVSSVSAGGIVSLFRAPGVGSIGSASKAGAIPRVEAIPSLSGREDSDSATRAAEDNRGKTLDPRRPESLFADSRREIRERLDELRGQKSSMERKQAEARGSRSSQVAADLIKLKSRDSEVRSHEAAHMAAGGRYVTGGASYTYQKGPDGGLYAVGGEVGIDTSTVPGKPEETVQKMRAVRAAALAPSEPSAADLSVAAAAAQAEASALAEMSQSRAASYSRSAKGEPPPNVVDMVA